MKATKRELFYDSISEVWEEKINNSETSKRLKVVFGRLLKNANLNNKKFLEVGCGLGYFSEAAFKKGARVTGIDIGKNLVEKAQNRVKKGKFIVAPAQKLPFKNNSFDVVLCTEVIEHVEEPLTAIDELKRVVKPGGSLVITTPNKLFKPLFDFLSFTGIRPYHGNEKWFYPWTLKRYLSEGKFDLLKEVYFNFLYPNPLFDFFERFHFLRYLMINQGYLLEKR